MRSPFMQINDVHLSDRAPRWRRDSYTDEIFEKLAWCVGAANSRNLDFIAICGDLFHNPAPSRVSHALVNRAMEILDQANMPVLIVPGNHDLHSGRMESLWRQPLGVLSRLSNVTILSSESPVFVSREGLRVVSHQWRYDLTASHIRAVTTRVGATRPDVLLTHAAVALRPNPFYDTILAEDLAGVAGVVCFGHLHPPEDPYKMGDTWFLNPGSVSRGSLSATDIERTPQVFLISILENDDVEVEALPIAAAKPASEIFRMEAALVEREESEAIARFVGNLRDTKLVGIDRSSLFESVRSMTNDSRIAALAQEILSSVE